jgi:hypothetical protein
MQAEQLDVTSEARPRLLDESEQQTNIAVPVLRRLEVTAPNWASEAATNGMTV